MDVVFEPAAGRLIFFAVAGIAILLLLIIKFKLQPLLAILLAAVFMGVGVGMPPQMIVNSINKGIGLTLQSIALLVGLGSMFGAILEISGGAETISTTLVKRFGEKKSVWALGITGLVIAIPVFFDAGLIILIPLAFGLAKKTGKSTLLYGIPLLGGLAVGHAFIPPTPGPILVAAMLNADLGLVIGLGLIAGTIAMILGGVVWGTHVGNKYNVPVPEHALATMDLSKGNNRKAPSFGTVVTIILAPLFLILLNTASGALISNGFESLKPIQPILSFVGTPFVALTIATLLALVLLGVKNKYTLAELEKVMTKSLEPAGVILLVTAGGGVLRYILEDSGIGRVVGDFVAANNMPVVVVAFIVALAVRISVGSATVAMTMAAGIVAAMPGVAALSPIDTACIVMAVAGGATCASHVNDSGFWLVKSLFAIDEKLTFKTWTVMETIVGGTGFVAACIISAIF
ncbi:MAG: GntP family permease [Spirochaetaceae bacterium]|jgi:GntP family gluconate:H+ symporter/Gnt-I system low-affinity gluconate transporter|nr:GntP family permease [Spirochaetaceae bacterium]